MIFGHIVVCSLVLLTKTQALIENCHVDNSICTSTSIPKLEVAFPHHQPVCNDILQIEDVTAQPQITYRQGVENANYLVVLLDPDAPYPCAHRDGSSFLHYMSVMTQVNGRLKPKLNIVSYVSPHPPVGIHRYQLFLFPWTSTRNPLTPNSRVGFKLDQYKKQNYMINPVANFQFRVPDISR